MGGPSAPRPRGLISVDGYLERLRRSDSVAIFRGHGDGPLRFRPRDLAKAKRCAREAAPR